MCSMSRLIWRRCDAGPTDRKPQISLDRASLDRGSFARSTSVVNMAKNVGEWWTTFSMVSCVHNDIRLCALQQTELECDWGGRARVCLLWLGCWSDNLFRAPGRFARYVARGNAMQ